METMYQRGKIQEESLYYETLKHTGEFPIIGVNTFLSSKGSPTVTPKEVIRATTEEKEYQINMLKALHDRNADKSADLLRHLQLTAIRNQNMFEVMMEVAKYCSLGQITSALFEVGWTVSPKYVIAVMKVRSIPVVFFLLLVASSLVGQDIDSVKPRPVYDVSIMSGGASGNSSIFGLNDFRKIYPASSILKRDLSGFSGYGENYFSEYFGFGVMVGRTSRQMRVLGERVKGTLRAGFYYDEASYFSYTLTDGSNTRVDTIKNSQGVSQFYIDSAYYKTANDVL
jgi:hypothetical protein